jgi:hypothetical protein
VGATPLPLFVFLRTFSAPELPCELQMDSNEGDCAFTFFRTLVLDARECHQSQTGTFYSITFHDSMRQYSLRLLHDDLYLANIRVSGEKDVQKE